MYSTKEKIQEIERETLEMGSEKRQCMDCLEIHMRRSIKPLMNEVTRKPPGKHTREREIIISTLYIVVN